MAELDDRCFCYVTARLFTVPYFSVGSLSSTGCHLGLTGKSTKCPWVGLVEVTAGVAPLHPHAFNRTATTHGNFVLSPVSLASRDQDGGPSDSTIMQHLRSHGKIGDCEQSTSQPPCLCPSEGHKHGDSIQSSLNLGNTLLRIAET